MKIQPVVLCGGSGTRLWPLSRETYPKQLLALIGEETLLQATVRRLQQSALPDDFRLADPLLVANHEYRFITAEQIRAAGVRASNIILEPVGRNTAPALTAAALLAEDDPVLVVMAADHVIADINAFQQAINLALKHAAEGKVVTFGILPSAPETGYGYILRGQTLADGTSEIARFVEKPDSRTAESYVASGNYYWNSGIFVVRASVWLEQIGQRRPDILAACVRAVDEGARERDFLHLSSTAFSTCPSDSIDYAVMEHLTDAGSGIGLVVPLAAGWSDVGAWNALWAISQQDDKGNALIGDVVALGSDGCYIRAEHRLVACYGLSDAIVVETADAVLVAHRDSIQGIKELVNHLKAEGRTEGDSHRKIFRPWGHYDSIDAGERFQVKRIVVEPGGTLSLQMHHHRAEHWIVVTGTAKVTKGNEVFLLTENQSTYIPLGIVHRLENPGHIPLEIIEVQSGAYLGEDDIVRFDDTYGRG